jgi:hypothetical protein
VSSLPQGGFGERKEAGRRRALIIGGMVLLAIVAWAYAVLSYGGDEAGAGKDGPADGRPAGQVGRASSLAADDGGPEAVPDENASAGDAPSDAQAPGDGSPPGAEPPAPAPSSGGSHDHPEGATNEPGSYDPLGTGATAGDLAGVDRERVEFAAKRFVSAAYGYSGDDEDAYNQAVGQTVAWPVFYDSEGSEEIERYAKQVEETGTKSGALLTRFEALETSPDSVEGYAYFETGSGYGPNGGLTGEKLGYRQHMTLRRSGAAWKVEATEKIEETR